MSGEANGEAFLTFYADNRQFAARAADIEEVFRRPKITRVPYSPAAILGLAGLRGAPAPVVSLARLVGAQDQPSADARVLLMRGAHGVGVAVDKVGSLTQLEAPADQAAGADFGRLYQVEDATLQLVDLTSLGRHDAAPLATRAASSAGAAGAAAHGEDRIALLSFQLCGQDYSLPLDEVEAVLAFPGAIAQVPQAHEAALGVIQLRECLVPIVSLGVLLGLDIAEPRAGRVIVTRVGEARIGLVVDRLNAILRPPVSALDAAPAALNRGDGSAQVEMICRLPDQAGLVAVLSAKRLFSDSKMAQILADGGREADEMTLETVESAERFVIFHLGDEDYGLPLSAVTEVVRLPAKLACVPNAPAFIEGVLALHGKLIPIIDQRRRFSSAVQTGEVAPRVIITMVDGRQAGFIVDRVSEILAVDPARIEPASHLTAEAGRLFSRVATLNNGERLVLLVEPKALLDHAERDLLDSLMQAPPS